MSGKAKSGVTSKLVKDGMQAAQTQFVMSEASRMGIGANTNKIDVKGGKAKSKKDKKDKKSKGKKDKKDKKAKQQSSSSSSDESDPWHSPEDSSDDDQAAMASLGIKAQELTSIRCMTLGEMEPKFMAYLLVGQGVPNFDSFTVMNCLEVGGELSMYIKSQLKSLKGSSSAMQVKRLMLQQESERADQQWKKRLLVLISGSAPMHSYSAIRKP